MSKQFNVLDAPVPLKGEPARSLSQVLETHDGLRLSGVWLIPGLDPEAVAVILPGSGNVGIDGDVSCALVGYGYQGQPAKLSTQLAEALSAAGIASFRYAKRGAEDPAQVLTQTLPNLAADLKAAISLAREEFPAKKIYLIGFSEGALVSALAAAEVPVDGLFLLGLVSRTPDEIFRYQFLEWPLRLLTPLDRDGDGLITSADFAALGPTGRLPLLGPDLTGVPWQDLDGDHDGRLSIEHDLVPAYRQAHEGLLSALNSPPFKNWLDSFGAIPPFAEIASRIKAPVRLYHATEDAQIPFERTRDDARLFAGDVEFKAFQGLGHCFSPMDGTIGQVKTSGPFDRSLLAAIVSDLESLIRM